MSSPRLFVSIVICAIACGVDLAHAATTYSASVTKSYLGWLDQYSLDTSTYHHVGPEACVPTTATNALTYLQRSAPSLFGTSLTGSGYTDWKAVDATLTSPGYMNTSVTNGTYLYTIPYALTQFVVDDRGFDSVKFSGMFEPQYWPAQFPKPDFITDAAPTWNFLYNAFVASTPVMLSIMYSNGNGHEVLGSGLKWTDSNGNGLTDSSENAELYFVDPLDPSLSYPNGQPGGGVKITTGHVWYDSAFDELHMSYDQYWGDLPYDANDYGYTSVTINSAFLMAVPEPATLVFLIVAAGALTLARNRTRMVPASLSKARLKPEA